MDADQFDAVIAVNFQAVVTMTRALLPVLTANPGSHLVALSSIFGIIAPPGQTAYCASKFAVRGFLESLRGELAPMGVGVTCVHPGGVRTNIARNAIVGTRLPAAQWEVGRDRFDQLLTLDPAAAAEIILRAVHRRRPRVLVGRDAVIMDKLARLLPVGNGRLLSAATRSVGPPLTARCRKATFMQRHCRKVAFLTAAALQPDRAGSARSSVSSADRSSFGPPSPSSVSPPAASTSHRLTIR